MLLFAILGAGPALNLAKYKSWLCVLIKLTNTSIAITVDPPVATTIRK